VTKTKLTENQAVRLLIRHLEDNKWKVGKNYCLSHQRGIDIQAKRGKTLMLIEVKGAKAHSKAPTKKRSHFSGGQINTHFGVAVVKALKLQHEYPKAIVAIAHPDDDLLRKHLDPIIPRLKLLNIRHYWVSKRNTILS
jgi:hypothetical protein